MTVKSVMRGMMTAVVALAALAAAPAIANAQGFFDGGWGGEEKWGGKRQSVPFG